MLKISVITELLSIIFKNYWLCSFPRYLENVLYQPIKRMTNVLLIKLLPSVSLNYLWNIFWKNHLFFCFSKIITYLLLISQVLRLMTHVSISFSILGPLLFLIYINDLPENLKLSAKFFVDDTSLFSTVYNATEYANLLDEDIKKILEWAFNWKMLFNPDITKHKKSFFL